MKRIPGSTHKPLPAVIAGYIKGEDEAAFTDELESRLGVGL